MTGRGASGMDTEYRSRLVTHLLALKDAPSTTLLDQVQAIGVTATRHMLFDKAVRLQHTGAEGPTVRDRTVAYFLHYRGACSQAAAERSKVRFRNQHDDCKRLPVRLD